MYMGVGRGCKIINHAFLVSSDVIVESVGRVLGQYS